MGRRTCKYHGVRNVSFFGTFFVLTKLMNDPYVENNFKNIFIPSEQ